MIDELKFDQRFLAVLSLIASVLTLVGMFLFRRFMAERLDRLRRGLSDRRRHRAVAARSSASTTGCTTGPPAATGGVVDARFIVLVNTALESPLGQIAMIPMLAWIANSAPANLKATYFAIMASFTNLALSASQLGTKYLNEIYVVTREVQGRGDRRDQGARRLQPARGAPDRPARRSRWRCRSPRYCSCARCG